MMWGRTPPVASQARLKAHPIGATNEMVICGPCELRPAGTSQSAKRHLPREKHKRHLCYATAMAVVGLRELRQRASELVRRAEAGEEITITVATRPSARLVPLAPQSWRAYDDVVDLFAGPADQDWAADHERIDQVLRDPRGQP